MQSISRRTAFTSVLAGTVLSGAIGSSLAFAQMSMPAPSKRTTAPARLQVTFHGQGFDPMTSHIVAGETITVASSAARPLKLTSAPGAPEKIEHAVAPHAAAALKFAKPGLYVLYDAATTRFDDKVCQVVARHDAKQFPLPAYAVILVTAANGRGLATTGSRISIPDSYMTFEPWAIVVNAGQVITFVNNDMDPHIVMPSPEPMLMPNPSGAGGALSSAVWLEKMQSFAPIALAAKNGKGVVTLSQPGLHHYYCPVHTVYDSTAYTFAPLKSYGGYPFIMDGVIVVLPT